MSENVKTALRVLLSEVIDYAGLFPPAGLSLPEAVQNYATYLNSDYAWMLGRFILPADQLGDFAENAKGFWSEKNSKPWRLSVLAEENLVETLRSVESFNAAHQADAVIDTLEIRANSTAHIREAASRLPQDLTVYFEIPFAATLSEQVSALAASKSRAKIRTGGVVVESFPPVDEIVKFLRISTAANVPFKATAGLHHPLRTVKPLTYEPGAPTGTMHGFLNLFLAAAFMRQNLNNNFVHKLMSDGELNNFKFDENGAEWNGQRVSLQQLELIRTRNAISFGSCSFVEPIQELQQFKLL